VSKCNRGSDNEKEVKVRAAQKRILAEIPNTIVGADLQSLTEPTFRYDGTHFNFKGIEFAANKWGEALLDVYFTNIKPLERSK
jgi:hypothetical protein